MHDSRSARIVGVDMVFSTVHLASHLWLMCRLDLANSLCEVGSLITLNPLTVQRSYSSRSAPHPDDEIHQMNIQIHGNSTIHHLSAQILMLLAVHSFQPESSDQLFNGSPSQLSWRRGPVDGAGSLRSHQTLIGLRRTARSIIEDNHGRCGPLAYW